MKIKLKNIFEWYELISGMWNENYVIAPFI